MKGIKNNNDIIGWIGRSYFNQSGAGSKSRRFQDGGKTTASPEPLSYGVSLRFIRNLENPHGKGLRNGRYFPYSDGSRAFGLGTDIRTNTTGKKLARRAYKEGIPMQEAHDIAVNELRNQDRVIMKNLVDEGYTTRPDTISHGVRLLGAQARYQRGNIKPVFHEWAQAVIDGDADRQKEIIGRYAKGDDRRNKIATFDPYYYQGGWHSERERKGYAPKKQDGGTFPTTNMGDSGFDMTSRLTKKPYISSDGITPDNPLFWVAVERLRSMFSPKQRRGQGGGGGAGSRFNPDTQYVDTIVKDTVYLPMQRTFNDAFGEARRRGLNEFVFQGKRYNTTVGDNPGNNLAGELRIEEYVIPVERKKKTRFRKDNK